MANLGTPDNYDYWSMRRYLNEFLSDKRVVDYPAWLWQPLLQLIILTKRPFTSGANYKSIWNHDKNESPLLTITKDQTAAIAQQITDRFGGDIMVDFCMRYGNPSTKSKVEEMVKAGCDRILFFPLYPHYAGATSATACDQFFRALMEQKWQPSARTVAPYFDHPAYIKALADSVRRAYDAMEEKPEVLVASYHGMPKRYLMQGDPYHCQCQKTTRLLREADRHHRGQFARLDGGVIPRPLRRYGADMKKGGGKPTTFFQSVDVQCDLARCNSSSNDQQKHDRNNDAARRRSCFFNNHCRLDDRIREFAVTASKSRSSSDGQRSSECDFLHSNLQNAVAACVAPTPRRCVVLCGNHFLTPISMDWM